VIAARGGFDYVEGGESFDADEARFLPKGSC
jgi:hypothetical protein